MTGRLIRIAKSPYQYPLILKQLWYTPLLQSPDQGIVYRDRARLTTASSDSASDDSHPPYTSSASGPATLWRSRLGQQSRSV
jgi:hypothetical protein